VPKAQSEAGEFAGGEDFGYFVEHSRFYREGAGSTPAVVLVDDIAQLTPCRWFPGIEFEKFTGGEDQSYFDSGLQVQILPARNLP